MTSSSGRELFLRTDGEKKVGPLARPGCVPQRVSRSPWKSAMQSEWICERAADALAVGAPRLQTLPRLEFDRILTVRDRP